MFCFDDEKGENKDMSYKLKDMFGNSCVRSARARVGEESTNGRGEYEPHWQARFIGYGPNNCRKGLTTRGPSAAECDAADAMQGTACFSAAATSTNNQPVPLPCSRLQQCKAMDKCRSPCTVPYLPLRPLTPLVPWKVGRLHRVLFSWEQGRCPWPA